MNIIIIFSMVCHSWYLPCLNRKTFSFHCSRIEVLQLEKKWVPSKLKSTSTSVSCFLQKNEKIWVKSFWWPTLYYIMWDINKNQDTTERRDAYLNAIYTWKYFLKTEVKIFQLKDISLQNNKQCISYSFVNAGNYIKFHRILMPESTTHIT